jgi:NAD+ kinase
MRIKIISKKKYPQLSVLGKYIYDGPNPDICIAIGGDGTFIRAAKECHCPILPIRSGERGSVGYYSDLTVSELEVAVESLRKGNYKTERLANLIELEYKGRKRYAVNEVRLNNITEEVGFKIYYVDGQERTLIYPYVMSGDGLIVTSLVGSTAYNRSAGGPILLTPDAICITFLNIDGPYSNPIVLDSSKAIEIELQKYPGILRYDNSNAGRLSKGDSFRVRLSSKQLYVVRINGFRESFSNKLDRLIKSKMYK